MNYENAFMNDYRKYSNLGSDFYRTGYQNILKGLNATAPTINTLSGAGMMHGGSYKSSRIIANAQRSAAEKRNADQAQSSLLDMYMRGQSLAQNSLQGAQAAYQYEDSKPNLGEELLGFAAGGLMQYATGGLLGGGNAPNTSGTPRQSPGEWQQNNNAMTNTAMPVGYKAVPERRPFNYRGW